MIVLQGARGAKGSKGNQGVPGERVGFFSPSRVVQVN